jgi:hypothetical protein
MVMERQNHEKGKVDEGVKIRKGGGFGERETKMVFDNAGVGMDFWLRGHCEGRDVKMGNYHNLKDIFIARGERYKGGSGSSYFREQFVCIMLSWTVRLLGRLVFV